MKRGFTLIELMIVVAIITLLTSIVLTNFGSSRAKARDSKRLSDVGQMQLILELYFDRCDAYPDSVGDLISPDASCAKNGIPTRLVTDSTGTLPGLISKIPSPPGVPTGETYLYKTNASKTDYILHTTLEYYNENLKDSLPVGSWTGVNCYGGGTVSKDYCAGPK